MITVAPIYGLPRPAPLDCAYPSRGSYNLKLAFRNRDVVIEVCDAHAACCPVPYRVEQRIGRARERKSDRDCV